MNRSVKLRVRDLHPHVTCHLCNGYFIDATTIIECLHSFCRTCIVRYLENRRSCPVCRVQVHKTRPLLNIRSDQTLQDIVYKLVPGLRSDEMKRRRRFWGENPESKKDFAIWRELSPEELGDADQFDVATFSSKVTLVLENLKRRNKKADDLRQWSEIASSLSKRYLRTSQDLTVNHLHKFLRAKLNEPISTEIVMLCGENVLPPTYTLADVRDTFSPVDHLLHLTYCIFVPRSLKRKPPPQRVTEKVDVEAKSRKTVAKKSSFRKKSATPHLKAFFNSQISPPTTEKQQRPFLKPISDYRKQDEIESLREAEEQKLIEWAAARDTRAKLPLFEKLQLTTVQRAAAIKRAALYKLANQKKAKEKQEYINSAASSSVQKLPQKKLDSQNEQTKLKSTKNEYKVTSQVPKGTNSPRRNIKQGSNEQFPSTGRWLNKQNNNRTRPTRVKCYSVLNIPVDEAVRSKPPTPVVDPLCPPVVLKRSSADPDNEAPPTKMKPFVQRTANNEVPMLNLSEHGNNKVAPKQQQFQRNRRKPIHPTHHASAGRTDSPGTVLLQKIDTSKTQFSTTPTRPISREPDRQQPGFDTIRIQSPNNGKFILLSTEGMERGHSQSHPAGLSMKLHSQMQQNRSSNDPRKLDNQGTMLNTANQDSQNKSQLQTRINSQAHRAALDAVRNTMGKVLLQAERPRQMPLKRPILPKGVSKPIHTGVGSIPIRLPTNQTRNIFQNEQVIYPMNKTVASSAASTSQSKAPIRTQPKPSPKSLSNNELEQLKKLREQQDFLNKLTEAAAINQLANRKKSSTDNSPQTSNQSPSTFRIKQHLSSQDNNRGRPPVLQADARVIPSPRFSQPSPAPRFQKPITQKPFERINSTSTRGRFQNSAPVSSPSLNRNSFPMRPTPQPNSNSHVNKQAQFTRLASGVQINSRPQQPSAKTLLLQSRAQDRPVGITPAEMQQRRQQYKTNPSTSIANNGRYNQQFGSRPPRFQQQQQQHPLPVPRQFMLPKSNTNPRQQTFQLRSSPNASMNRHPIATNQRTRQVPSIIRRSFEKMNPRPKSVTPTNRGQIQARSNLHSRQAHVRVRSTSHEVLAPTATPPAGTKSPWSSRGYPLPAVPTAHPSEYATQHEIHKPPLAHQQPSSNNFARASTSIKTNALPLSDMQPLELTAKKNTNSTKQTIDDGAGQSNSDQPLCLVMKK
nr:polycomb group protein Psc [Ciona intestinalis]|eukprot:XP_002129324.1 polycomb group protein Psc [Ciona intestinalis]